MGMSHHHIFPSSCCQIVMVESRTEMIKISSSLFLLMQEVLMWLGDSCAHENPVTISFGTLLMIIHRQMHAAFSPQARFNLLSHHLHRQKETMKQVVAFKVSKRKILQISPLRQLLLTQLRTPYGGLQTIHNMNCLRLWN